jgi:hypothetical protein
MPLRNMKNRCTAKSKTTGERCQCPAVTGYTVCYHHGANLKNPGGRKKGSKKPENAGGPAYGNTSGLKHGAYSPRLSPEEQPIYEAFLVDYLEDVANPSATDRRALERLAVLETKWHTAVTQGAPPDALDVLHRLLHRELKALQVTRESKDTSSTAGTTPAEVIAALMLKVRERAIEVQPQPALAADGNVVEAEIVDNGGGGDGD